MRDIAVFSLHGGGTLAARVCARLGVECGRHEEREFEDGEHKIRPLESVRGRDVYVVQSLFGDPAASVNDRLCRTLFFLAALRDAGAERTTAVVPYLCYARKERRTKPRDPVTTRYVALLFEAVGIDRMVTIDVHDQAAYENAFRVPAEHLSAVHMFTEWFAPVLGDREAVVVSPDPGGVKRAERFRIALERRIGRAVASGFVEKFRSEGVVSGGSLIGDVAGRVAIVLDDLVGSGTTLARAASACRANGACTVLAAVTHGLFVGEANRVLAGDELERLVVVDTLVPHRLDPGLLTERVVVLDAAPLLAAAIERLHGGGSIVDLMQPDRA